jgi:hypothetical protein
LFLLLAAALLLCGEARSPGLYGGCVFLLSCRRCCPAGCSSRTGFLRGHFVGLRARPPGAWRDHAAPSRFALELCVADAALRLECPQELPFLARALILGGAFASEQERTERAGQQRSPDNEQSGMRHRSEGSSRLAPSRGLTEALTRRSTLG